MQEKKAPTVVDVLRRMKRLLRQGWTQGALARGKSGRVVEAGSRAAVSFCLMGARQRAVQELRANDCDHWDKPRELIEMCANGIAAENYNDALHRTKDEILAVVGCAIKKAAPRLSRRSNPTH